jgi:hypothetical protein
VEQEGREEVIAAWVGGLLIILGLSFFCGLVPMSGWLSFIPIGSAYLGVVLIILAMARERKRQQRQPKEN